MREGGWESVVVVVVFVWPFFFSSSLVPSRGENPPPDEAAAVAVATFVRYCRRRFKMHYIHSRHFPRRTLNILRI